MTLEEQAFIHAPDNSIIDSPAYPNYTDTDIFVEGFINGAQWALKQASQEVLEFDDLVDTYDCVHIRNAELANRILNIES